MKLFDSLEKINLKEFVSSIFFACVIYAIIAIGFSFLGILFDEAESQSNPLENPGFNFKHMSSHMLWGAIVGIVSFRFRYVVLASLFTVIMDFDHLIGIFEIDSIGRMSHGVPFAMISLFIMILIFGREKYMLGIVAFAAVFSHISLDIFHGTGEFPIFAPFSSEIFFFYGYDWIAFQLIGMIVIGIGTFYLHKIKN